MLTSLTCPGASRRPLTDQLVHMTTRPRRPGTGEGRKAGNTGACKTRGFGYTRKTCPSEIHTETVNSVYSVTDRNHPTSIIIQDHSFPTIVAQTKRVSHLKIAKWDGVGLAGMTSRLAGGECLAGVGASIRRHE